MCVTIEAKILLLLLSEKTPHSHWNVFITSQNALRSMYPIMINLVAFFNIGITFSSFAQAIKETSKLKAKIGSSVLSHQIITRSITVLVPLSVADNIPASVAKTVTTFDSMIKAVINEVFHE